MIDVHDARLVRMVFDRVDADDASLSFTPDNKQLNEDNSKIIVHRHGS